MKSVRIAQDFDLASMDRSELEGLLAEIQRLLDARQFEENLRRELQSHLRRRNPANGR